MWYVQITHRMITRFLYANQLLVANIALILTILKTILQALSYMTVLNYSNSPIQMKSEGQNYYFSTDNR